jgi:methyl-accepting chemotaxis protein
MSIKTKFYFILSGFGLAIILSTVASYFIIKQISDIYYNTMDKVKVNGLYYNKIVMSKDLIADILPPPMYIVESYLICNQIYNEKDPVQLNEFLNKSSLLKQEYFNRENVWKSSLPEGDMKNDLLNGSKDAAYKFFDIRDNQFIPAIKNGNYGKANQLLLGELNDIFKEHKLFIEKVVSEANKLSQKNESDSNEYQSSAVNEIKDLISFDTILLLVINIVILIVLSAITLLIIIKFVGDLNKATERILKLSDGIM